MITPELESTIERYSAAIAAIENTIQTYAIVQATIVRDRTRNNALKSATRKALNSANASKSQLQQAANQAKQVMAEKSVEAIVRDMNAVLNADATNHVELYNLETPHNVETRNVETRNFASHWDEEIQNIIDTAAKEISKEQILEVLTSRDAVQVALSQEMPIFTGKLLETLKRGDRYLKSRKWLELIDRIELGEWREIFHPPKTAWWWYLELPPPPTPPEPPSFWTRYDGLWNILTLFCLTICVSLVVEIASRFLSGGSDPGSVFAVISPTLLTYLSGKEALTEKGKQDIQRRLDNWNLPPKYFQEASFLLSGSLCLFILIFYTGGLPQIARIYNYIGQQHIPGSTPVTILGETPPELPKSLTKAEYYFSRALKLNPDYAKAYDNLGQVYEQLQELEKAEQQYQLAVKLQYPPAYPHLANVTLEGGNHEKADEIVRKGLEMAKEQPEKETLKETLEVLNQLAREYNRQGNIIDTIPLIQLGLDYSKEYPDVQYDLQVNYGWAFFNKQDYYPAKSRLMDAKELLSKIQSKEKKTDYYCLLGMVLEKIDPTSNAEKEAWRQCLQGDNRNRDQAIWNSLANKRLKSLRTGESNQ